METSTRKEKLKKIRAERQALMSNKSISNRKKKKEKSKLFSRLLNILYFNQDVVYVDQEKTRRNTTLKSGYVRELYTLERVPFHEIF